jgi:hypothetical protein
MNLEMMLTEPQEDFVFSDATFPLFVGGFGAGKSEALIKRSIIQKLAYPHLNQGYFAPTFDLIRLIAWDRYQSILTEWGIPFKANKSDRVIQIMGLGGVIFRSMENPDGIVGFEIADAVIDELDTLKIDHATNAWNKVIARGRQFKPDGKPNTTAVGTTPEGFRFCYDRWVRNGGGEYQFYRAPTASNPFLPASYIQSLRDTYPPQLLSAYLEGEFVNLVAGGVYPEFSRSLNGSDATIQAREPLHIGMDFNVNNMAAVVYVMRDRLPHAVDELMGVRDTPAMVALIKERFADHAITVYPDAAGQATSSKDSSISDHIILRNAGFALSVLGVNPSIKDRVNAVNALILNGAGERRLKVNADRCPRFTESLEQQAYDKHGQPDKSGGLDHAADAGGYAIAKLFPIAIPKIQTSAIIPPRVNHWGNR